MNLYYCYFRECVCVLLEKLEFQKIQDKGMTKTLEKEQYQCLGEISYSTSMF